MSLPPQLEQFSKGEFRIQESYYDPASNRFTQAFQNSNIQVPFETVSQYLQSLTHFTNIDNFMGIGESQLYDTLMHYIQKTTANPESILAFINLYDLLITFINNGIGIEKENSTTLPKVVNPTNNQGNGSSQYESNLKSKSKN